MKTRDELVEKLLDVAEQAMLDLNYASACVPSAGDRAEMEKTVSDLRALLAALGVESVLS